MYLDNLRDGKQSVDVGVQMHELAKRLFPICRSLTGNGVRQTLNILKEILPELSVKEVPSGTQCFDWVVPDEWNINDAYVLDQNGTKIIDFKKSNLHVLNYSEPVHKKLNLDELQQHLYSLPEMPEAIPYVTSYYKRRWGFCLSHQQRQQLKPGEYTVHIDSSLKAGNLSLAELIIPGDLEKEVFLSTYVCHPSLANNELSGPVVTAFLARALYSLTKRKYTYRIVFIPETIGSIVYLSQHHEKLIKNIYAGFNVTCVGDNRTYSYLPSRNGKTISDKVIQHVLKHSYPNYKIYTYRDRGSDERQYCSPGIDLPIATLMRSKYGTYPEYHTSLDDLTLVTPEGLKGSYDALLHCLKAIEVNHFYHVNCLGEPQLGKRGLYPTIGTKNPDRNVRDILDILSYCDGKHDLIDLADLLDKPVWEITSIIDTLVENKLIS